MTLLTGYITANWLHHCSLVTSRLIGYIIGYVTADWLYHCWLVMSLLTTQQPPTTTHLPLWWCWRTPWSRVSWGQPESWRRAWRTGRRSASPRSAHPCTARTHQMQSALLQQNTPSVNMHCKTTSDATCFSATKHTKRDHALQDHVRCNPLFCNKTHPAWLCTARRQMQPAFLQQNTPSVTIHCKTTSDATCFSATEHTERDHAWPALI